MKHGGRAEFDAVKGIIAKPATPQMGIAAMRAMGATDDAALREETWEYIMTKSRDQDLFYFFVGLQENPKSRHFLAEKFKENYDDVRFPFSSFCLVIGRTLVDDGLCVPALQALGG